MEVSELARLKQSLQDQIKSLLRGFTKSTGYPIQDVTLYLDYTTPYPGSDLRLPGYEVRVDIDITAPLDEEEKMYL